MDASKTVEIHNRRNRGNLDKRPLKTLKLVWLLLLHFNRVREGIWYFNAFQTLEIHNRRYRENPDERPIKTVNL